MNFDLTVTYIFLIKLIRKCIWSYRPYRLTAFDSISRDMDNRGVETHSSCNMYANVETQTLLEYLRNTTEFRDREFQFPYNETTSE